MQHFFVAGVKQGGPDKNGFIPDPKTGLSGASLYPCLEYYLDYRVYGLRPSLKSRVYRGVEHLHTVIVKRRTKICSSHALPDIRAELRISNSNEYQAPTCNWQQKDCKSVSLTSLLLSLNG